MKSTWTGIILCGLVLYYGVVHALPSAEILLNSHAIILVFGGTIAIAFLTFPTQRLIQMMDFIYYGFLFRIKKTEQVLARDLISHIDLHYQKSPSFQISKKLHPFLVEATILLNRADLDLHQLEGILLDRRNAVKRQYIEDAKMLNKLAKYPPHLGLMGAASGMILMMSGLGKDGIQSIGASMAVALTATLWGVGLNNFVFLPLSDNSMKTSEDEIYLRDVIIDCCLKMKKNRSYDEVIRSCLNKMSLMDRVDLRLEYASAQESKRDHAA